MWRIYYDDGSTWDHTQGMDGMPAWGVLCVLQVAPQINGIDRYHITYGCSYYMRADDEWLHSYENDIVDRLVHGMPIEKLLIGRMVSKKVFNAAYEKAKADKDAENL